jgi:hypothetical protein
MGKYICTIASKGYLKYLTRFITSVRGAGWRGEIVVLSSDDIPCNETVIIHDDHFKTRLLSDNRWMQFEVDKYFKDGDHVLYLDCDMVVYDNCNFDELFKHTLLVSTLPGTHDVTGELPELSKILERPIKSKYIASPFVFKINKEAKDFFKLCRMMSYISQTQDRGTLFAFNLACQMRGMGDVPIYPKSKVKYTLDVVFGKSVPKATMFHYGGAKGKRLWEQDQM